MRAMIVATLVGFVLTTSLISKQPSVAPADHDAGQLQVILLGAGGCSAPNPVRFGTSPLVIAGTEKLMFDCGRAATSRRGEMCMLLGEVNRLFITHLHSDHV